MRKLGALLVVSAILGLSTSADALVLCARKKANGSIQGVVKVREECKFREVELDPVELGLQGPAGEPGEQGPPGEDGSRGSRGSAGADGTDGTDGEGVCLPNVPASPQFVDNGDGTVTDQHTCLMWEQKTGTFVGFTECPGGATCEDPHEVDNVYVWSSTGTAADGPVYSDFLERVNGKLCGVSWCVGLGGHTDWRIPTAAELESIQVPLFLCGVSFPCIDSIFVDPPTYDTAPFFYWSATTAATSPTFAWIVPFDGGMVAAFPKTSSTFVRAVRGGS